MPQPDLSNTSHSLSPAALQRQIQQRSILQTMGIDCWITRDRKTNNIHQLIKNHHISDRTLTDLNQPITTHLLTESDVKTTTQSSVKSLETTPDTILIPKTETITISTTTEKADQVKNPSTQLIQAQPVDTTSESLVTQLVESQPVNIHPTDIATQNHPAESLVDHAIMIDSETPNKSEYHTNTDINTNELSFRLLAIHHNRWVMLVDEAQLTHTELQLWQSLCSRLHQLPETFRFPICAGMDSLELAQISVAGFVFRIANLMTSPNHSHISALHNTSTVQCIALTSLPISAMPGQLTMVTAPTLKSMLEQPSKKRQLWQLITGKSSD